MELIRRKAAEGDLTSWCITALAPLGLTPARHHLRLIKELEDIASGENDRLMVLMPPGSAKSTYVSKLFPPFFLAQKPYRSVIGASHTATLAEDFSRDVQTYVRENTATLGYKLISEPAELWKTSNGGRYRAAGVGGPITGSRADCLTGDTIVLTTGGFTRMYMLAEINPPCCILSYDESIDASVWRSVLAVARRRTDEIYQITTASGRVVEATGKHKIFTKRGYVPAKEITKGDVLLRSLWEASDPESGDAVQELPHEVARGREIEVQNDPVALVERLRREADVYDIQVEGTHCFFANGILVSNCAIIDDPVKSRADADSEPKRDAAWKWFLSDLRTRLKPGAPIVLVMTRWHEDDLGGRILQTQANKWRVLSLPAIAEPGDALGRAVGEPLWDDDGYGYSSELGKMLGDYEMSGAMRDWYALYQQSPRPAEGALFKVAKFGRLDDAPRNPAVLVRAWDLAATQQMGTRNPDWTVGVLMARYRDNSIGVLDVQRMRGGPDQVEALIKATAAEDGKNVTIGLPQDPGQAGKSQLLYLTRALVGYRVASSPESGSKATRAGPYASQVNMGNVFLVNSDRWNRAYVDELALFPSGTKDDCVDASSRAFEMVAQPMYDQSLQWVGSAA